MPLAFSSKAPPTVAVITDLSLGSGRDVMRGVTRYANLRRKWALCFDLHSKTPLDHLPECDGAIVADNDQALFERVAARSRHVVRCSSLGEPAACPVVQIDDEAAGAMAAEHLLSLGLSSFAYLGWDFEGFDQPRHRGFRRRLAQAGFDDVATPLPWGPWEAAITHENHPKLIEWIRSLPMPLGVLAVDDRVSNDLALACLNHRVAVPERVAIVGIEDDALPCESAWPPLSSVRCDFDGVGYQAARLLERMLDGETLSEEERLLRLPPLGLVERQSTDIVAIADPELADALRYIRHHACDPCTVSDVLRQVPVSRRWLETRFSEHLSRTPHSEITRVRMETASGLLLANEWSMREVAKRCGYATVQSFTKAFQSAVGETPASFRRRRLGGRERIDAGEADAAR